jgi:beta-lactamase class C
MPGRLHTFLRLSGRVRLSTRFVSASIAALTLVIVLLVGFSGTLFSARSDAGATNSQQHGIAEISEAQRRSTVIDYRRLDDRLRLLAERQAVVGLAVGVVEDGEIRFLKGYGETIAGSGDFVTPDTVFRWASLSKGVAGDMVAKLAAEGRVSIDAPVAKYRTSLRLPAGNEQRATVGDLLSHQLGLFSHAEESKLEDGGDPRFLRASLGSLNAICAPGQCHAYQNVAYDAASEIVETVTGQPYQQAVRQRLFLPLGMRTASVTREGLESAKSWARPHVGGKHSRPVEVTESYYRVPAAGGVNSSIKDLALWLQAQMGRDPDVLGERVLATVQAARAKTPGELGRMRKFRERLHTASYGLGWRIYDYAGHRVIGHRGGVTGYRSLILFDPVLKTGVVALWNSSTSQPAGIEFEVMDMLYKLPARDWLALGTSADPGSDDADSA